jgi:small GTP-binding protein
MRFSEGQFFSSSLPTIGVDYKSKVIEVDGKFIKLQIWDTSGQERFKTITINYYKKAKGVILVYDCTDDSSFDNVQRWLE